MALHILMMMTGAPAKQAALGITGMKALGLQLKMASRWSASQKQVQYTAGMRSTKQH